MFKDIPASAVLNYQDGALYVYVYIPGNVKLHNVRIINNQPDGKPLQMRVRTTYDEWEPFQ